MSHIFTNMKMKYKLMLICSIPFIVMLYFVGSILWEDYRVIQEMEDDLHFINIYEQAAKVLNRVDEEKSVLSLSSEKIAGFDRARQQVAAALTDDEVKKMREQIQEGGAISLEKGSLSELFAPVFEKVSFLRGPRRGAEEVRALEPKDAGEIYSQIEQAIFNQLNEMSRSIYDLELARTSFALISLMHEKAAIGSEREILTAAVAKKARSEKDLLALSQAIGKQLAFQSIFFEVGDDSQDEIYQKAARGSADAASGKSLQEALDAIETGKLKSNSQEIWETLTKRIAELDSVQERLVKEALARGAELKHNKLLELLTIVILLGASLSLAIILVSIALRTIVKRLQEEIVILSTAGNEIKSSITEASSGTSETAASVTETTTTVEELKQTAEIAAEKAKKVAEVSSDAIGILSTGEKNLEKTIEGMLHIQNGMSTISDSIIKLSEHSQSIGKIIDTVNELAEQSHLLAVNAAIEAAKAGEQGKGFSVVAQEVRSLAEQSKQATVQVRNILSDIQNATSAAVMATEQGTKAVNNGVEMSNQIGVSIQSLSDGINKVSEASSQIALSSEQQLIGVSQVNVAMTNIREATEKHVEHMQLIEKAIEGMNTVGLSLKDLVTKF